MRRDVFQAIADPTRRAILVLVAIQAMTPNALAEKLDRSRQSVSKHLRILRECEMINQEQVGREIFYHLDIGKVKEVEQWLDQIKQVWENRYKQLDNLLVTLKTGKAGNE